MSEAPGFLSRGDSDTKPTRASIEAERESFFEEGMMHNVAICDLALSALTVSETKLREIGHLHRGRTGEVHFIQKDDELEFPLHSTIKVYGGKPE